MFPGHNQRKSNMKRQNPLLLAGLLALSATCARAQNGPVTSNLKRVLVYINGYSSDHANTVNYAGHLINLAKTINVTVDTTRSNSVFTAANLANYQALVLFNAYNFGTNLTSGQKDAVRLWYAGNRGLACFHQCTKHDWGASPSWMDNVMGVRYQTYAGFGTGPIYVHADAVGTDLAQSSAGSGYAADFTMSWDDEWYTYQANPDPLPNTRMIWTTRRSAFNFGGGASGFYLSGEVQPLAWARDVEGGRYVMNSLFHRDVPRTSSNQQMRQFVDGAFLGTMRYVAGYTGCTDNTKPGYNPKATHHNETDCAPTGIRVVEAPGASADLAGGVRISVTAAGPHAVEVFDAAGKPVYSRRGVGAAEYSVARSRPGMHFVRVRAGGNTESKRLLLL